MDKNVSAPEAAAGKPTRLPVKWIPDPSAPLDASLAACIHQLDLLQQTLAAIEKTLDEICAPDPPTRLPR